MCCAFAKYIINLNLAGIWVFKMHVTFPSYSDWNWISLKTSPLLKIKVPVTSRQDQDSSGGMRSFLSGDPLHLQTLSQSPVRCFLNSSGSHRPPLRPSPPAWDGPGTYSKSTAGRHCFWKCGLKPTGHWLPFWWTRLEWGKHSRYHVTVDTTWLYYSTTLCFGSSVVKQGMLHASL